MAWQQPKPSHPWKRSYKVNLTKEQEQKAVVKKKTVKPVKVFVAEIIGNWENVEIYTMAYGRQDRFRLEDLPQFKQAAWLAGLLKQQYG